MKVNREEAQEKVRSGIRKYGFVVPDIDWFVDESILVLGKYLELIDILPLTLKKKDVQTIIENLHRYSLKIYDRAPEEKKGRLSDLNRIVKKLVDENSENIHIVNEIVRYTSEIGEYKGRVMPGGDAYKENRDYFERLLRNNAKRDDKVKSVYAEIETLPFESQEKLLEKTRIFMTENASNLNEEGIVRIICGAINAVEMGLKAFPKSPDEHLCAYFEKVGEKIRKIISLQQVY